MTWNINLLHAHQSLLLDPLHVVTSHPETSRTWSATSSSTTGREQGRLDIPAAEADLTGLIDFADAGPQAVE